MFAVYCQIFSKSRLIFLKLLRVSRVHTKHHGWQPPGKMANIENCQQIVRLVMMVMTYSASVLVNVEGGEHEGNAFFHLVQLRSKAKAHDHLSDSCKLNLPIDFKEICTVWTATPPTHF